MWYFKVFSTKKRLYIWFGAQGARKDKESANPALNTDSWTFLTSGQPHDPRQSIRHIKKTWTSGQWSFKHAINGATGANSFCHSSRMHFFLELRWIPFSQCVHFNVSNNRDLQHEKQTKKKPQAGDSWSGVLETMQGVGRRPGWDESVSFPCLLPVFAHFRLRGANGSNSHWLQASVCTV